MAFEKFPLWLNDWRGSTARMTLSLEGRAVYLELMFAQYQLAGEGLPADREELARWAACRPEQVTDAVLERFETDPETGRLHHPKVRESIAFQQARSDAGKRGAKRRWNGG